MVTHTDFSNECGHFFRGNENCADDENSSEIFSTETKIVAKFLPLSLCWQKLKEKTLKATENSQDFSTFYFSDIFENSIPQQTNWKNFLPSLWKKYFPGTKSGEYSSENELFLKLTEKILFLNSNSLSSGNYFLQGKVTGTPIVKWNFFVAGEQGVCVRFPIWRWVDGRNIIPKNSQHK